MNISNEEELRLKYHRELNCKRPKLEQLAEKTQELSKEIKERKLITSLEGDIIEYGGKIYFAHILYAKIRHTYNMFNNKFSVQRAQGKAAEFDEVISYLINNYKDNLGPIELHVELKDNLNYKTIKIVDDGLKASRIPYCFMSYYGDALDITCEINKDVDRVYIRLGSINNHMISLFPWNEPKFEPTINSISPSMIKGKMTIPRMHGVVKNLESIKELAKDINVRAICTEYELL